MKIRIGIYIYIYDAICIWYEIIQLNELLQPCQQVRGEGVQRCTLGGSAEFTIQVQSSDVEICKSFDFLFEVKDFEDFENLHGNFDDLIWGYGWIWQLVWRGRSATKTQFEKVCWALAAGVVQRVWELRFWCPCECPCPAAWSERQRGS